MSTDVVQLKEVLTQLVGDYKAVLPLFLEERALLEARDAEGIEASALQVQQALEALKKRDESRQALTRKMGADLRIPDDQLTLETLDRALGSGSGLLPLREALREAIGELVQINNENRAILDGLKAATEEIMSGVKKSAQPKTYNRKGYQSGAAGGSLLSKHL